jgi:hypothetical protein
MHELASLASSWRAFAVEEASGRSPLYEALSLGVASDPEVLARLSRLSPREQQPNLLLAVVRYLGGTGQGYPEFRTFTLEHWPRVASELGQRRTQTNEVGRCGVLYPALATLDGPLALLEVGASAGLLLLPDRYRFEYDGRLAGDLTSSVKIRTAPRGWLPLPSEMPEVIWRAGIDLNPLDVTNEHDVAWLRASIWPDETDRLARFEAAVRLARAAPPRLVEGDLLEGTGDLAAQAPAGSHLVIYHAATLAYLTEAERDRFRGTLEGLGGTWVSFEHATVLADVLARAPSSSNTGGFLLSRDGIPLAFGGSHGAWIEWVDRAPRIVRRVPSLGR